MILFKNRQVFIWLIALLAIFTLCSFLLFPKYKLLIGIGMIAICFVIWIYWGMKLYFGSPTLEVSDSLDYSRMIDIPNYKKYVKRNFIETSYSDLKSKETDVVLFELFKKYLILANKSHIVKLDDELNMLRIVSQLYSFETNNTTHEIQEKSINELGIAPMVICPIVLYYGREFKNKRNIINFEILSGYLHIYLNVNPVIFQHSPVLQENIKQYYAHFTNEPIVISIEPNWIKLGLPLIV